MMNDLFASYQISASENMRKATEVDTVIEALGFLLAAEHWATKALLIANDGDDRLEQFLAAGQVSTICGMRVLIQNRLVKFNRDELLP